MRKSISLFVVACLVGMAFIGGRVSKVKAEPTLVAIPRIKLEGFPDPNGDGWFASTTKTDGMNYYRIWFETVGTQQAFKCFEIYSYNHTTGMMNAEYIGEYFPPSPFPSGGFWVP